MLKFTLPCYQCRSVKKNVPVVAVTWGFRIEGAYWTNVLYLHDDSETKDGCWQNFKKTETGVVSHLTLTIRRDLAAVRREQKKQIVENLSIQ